MERSSSNKNRPLSPQSGFVIIEALIGVVLASILLTVFLALSVQAAKINRASQNTFQAELYLKELVEIAKDLEQSDWCELTVSACSSWECHPEISAGKWRLIGGAESVGNNKFTRSIVISEVKRNQLVYPNEIILAGGVSDTKTKKATAQISWADASHPAMALEIYLYNYNDSLVCP